MYKLIATDLDGTLINHQSQLPENNKQAIARAIAAGVHVCLCSGRSYLSLGHFEEQLGLHLPGNYGIGFNGSLTYQTWDKGILRDVRMENDLAMFLVDELAQFGENIVVYIRDKLMVRQVTESIRFYTEKSRIPFTVIPDLHAIKEDVSKVLLRADHQVLQQVYAHMQPLVQGRCNCFFSDKTLLEFTHLEATKGAALTYLAGHLGIDMSEVIAVGDQLNDIHMLEAAGLGVAVANAHDLAKAAANTVTTADCDAGALAEVVERFIGV